MKGRPRKWPRVALLVVAVVALALAGLFALLGEGQASGTETKVSSQVLADTADGGEAAFVVYLGDQADVSDAYKITDEDARGRYVYNALRTQAAETQGPIRAKLEAAGVPYKSYWGVNMIVAEGDRAIVEELAARSDVAAIESNAGSDGLQGEDAPETVDEGNAVEATEVGVTNTQSPSLWTLGFRGQGMVIANQDTGMRWTHAALRTHYRGWGGSVATSDHNYNWWDAVHSRITNADGGTPSGPAPNSCGFNLVAPCDDQGHGTHTTGTTVGDDAGAGIGTGTNQIGVAPGAKWIGCRNMDAGNGRASTYTECFQFFIAPTDLAGQNADPTKRPHVMNNSWGCPLAGELCARERAEDDRRERGGLRHLRRGIRRQRRLGVRDGPGSAGHLRVGVLDRCDQRDDERAPGLQQPWCGDERRLQPDEAGPLGAGGERPLVAPDCERHVVRHHERHLDGRPARRRRRRTALVGEAEPRPRHAADEVPADPGVRTRTSPSRTTRPVAAGSPRGRTTTSAGAGSTRWPHTTSSRP